MEKYQKEYLTDIAKAAHLVSSGITESVIEALEIVDGVYDIPPPPYAFDVVYKSSHIKDFCTIREKIRGKHTKTFRVIGVENKKINNLFKRRIK